MARKCIAPAARAGASRDKLAGVSLFSSNLEAYRAQFLTFAYSVPPDRAVMLAALAFGGGND